MHRFTLLLASAPVVVFSSAAPMVGHTTYVGLAGRSLDRCLASSWLSDPVAT
jgi:hypothetical protein